MTAAAITGDMRDFWKTSTRQVLALTLVVGILLAVVVRSREAKPPEVLRNDRLLLAAAGNDLEGVERAIADGADVRAFDESIRTALSYAVQHDNLAMVDALLAAGADPEQPFRLGADSIKPLQYAVRNDQIALVERLLASNATGTIHHAVLSCAQSGQLDMLEVLLQKFDPGMWTEDLAKAKNLEMLRFFLERSEPDRRSDTVKGRLQAALDVALRDHDEALCDLLCEFGGPYTAREAAAFNRIDDVQRMLDENPALLRQRFRPYFHSEFDEDPTLLGIALCHGHRDLAKCLIVAGAPLEAMEWPNATLMHRAAVAGDAELIRLLAARCLPVNSLDGYQDTPLGEAAARGHVQAVEAFLGLGADPNLPCRMLPLHSAANDNNAEIAHLLLEAGADPAARSGGKDPKTPLEVAKERGSLDVVRVLEAHAAKN